MMAKRKRWTITELSEKAEPVRRLLQEESDRGAALIGTAYLDDLLATLLRAVFVDRCADKLLELNRPLGTFDARIRLAYSIGLIRTDTYKDLEAVRGIRNDFAHLHDNLAFESESVKTRSENLHYGKLLKALRDHTGMITTAKERFVFSVAILGQALISTANTARRAIPGDEFYVGFFPSRHGSSAKNT